MCSIEIDVPIPLTDDVAYSLDGKREQRHRGSQRNHPGSNQWCNLAEEVQVNIEFDWIERDIHDLQTTDSCWPVETIARMATKGLSNTYNDVARFSQCRIDRHIADHTCHQPLVCIAGTKRFFQEFDTQRFDLINILCAGKPTFHRANMSLSSAGTFFRRGERAN